MVSYEKPQHMVLHTIIHFCKISWARLDVLYNLWLVAFAVMMYRGREGRMGLYMRFKN